MVSQVILSLNTRVSLNATHKKAPSFRAQRGILFEVNIAQAFPREPYLTDSPFRSMRHSHSSLPARLPAAPSPKISRYATVHFSPLVPASLWQ